MELDFAKNPSILGRVVDAMAAGLFTVDATGRFVAWSAGAERITGYSRQEVVGQPCSLLEGHHCKGFASLRDLLATAEPCGEDGVCSQECKLLSKTGREIYIHGSVRVVYDDEGRVAGAVGCFTDLTEFVLANEKISLLEQQARQPQAFDKLLGRSNGMQEVFQRLRLAAQRDVTVFLSGESGTGKELAAAAIHSVSSRSDKPFIAVNCSAIPEALLESELFGHVRGAFTDAVRDKAGVFQAADGGTLFLDEIGDISPQLQVKLLRVLEQREYRRVGDDRATPADVRLITATNRDLAELMEQGEFREDFYYRIHVFEVRLPPLRERREDIPLLAEAFLRELSTSRGREVTGIARDALQRMMDYRWPGNVRELRNAMEHALVTVGGETVTMFDLPVEIREPRRDSSAAPAPTPPALTADQEADRRRLLDALEQTDGNKTAAAKLLGISRVTMWKRAKKYGIA